MNSKRTRNWLLSAAIALGTATFGANAEDREKDVRMADLPREARQQIDKERGNREIKKLEHVWRNGNEWYRATVDDRGGRDTEIRVTPDGQTLSEQRIREMSERRGGGNNDVRGNDRGRNDRDSEEQVRLANVPRDVREVIDRERGRNEVKAVYEVKRDGRTFYRAIIDDRGGDRMLRVAEGGKLLQESDIREVRPAGANIGGGGVRRGMDDDGDRVSFERLPGEVKTVIAREAGSDKVGDVYRYDRRGGSVYEADIESGTRTRVIRVNENGRVLSEKDDTPEGRRSVSFRDLPGAVKSGIASQVNENDIARVVQVTRNDRTFYRALVEKGGDRRWITVDESGRIANDFDRGR